MIKRFHILSIQSHVTHGLVGNRAASLVFHTLGHQVDEIHTTLFSNHTGYAIFKGQRTSPELIREIWQGLRENKLYQDYTHVLVGGYQSR